MITDQIIHHHVSHIDDFFFNQTSNIAMHWEEKDSVWVFIVLVFFFCCKCHHNHCFSQLSLLRVEECVDDAKPVRRGFLRKGGGRHDPEDSEVTAMIMVVVV